MSAEKNAQLKLRFQRESDRDGETLLVAKTRDHGPLVISSLGRGRWVVSADWRLPVDLWIRQSEWLIRIGLHQKEWPTKSALRDELTRALKKEKRANPSELIVWSAADQEAYERHRAGLDRSQIDQTRSAR